MDKYGKIQGIKKIAVLRSNALGDFIFSLPALHALKKTYEDAELVYLGKKWHQEFLADRPTPVDRVIVVPPIRGVSEKDTFKKENSSEISRFYKLMKKERFDLAVQIHGGGRYSNPFLKKLGAKLTIGLKTPDAQVLNLSIPYIYYQNEILRYLEVVKLVGARTTDYTPQLKVIKKDLDEIKELIPKKPFIILHPGSTDVKRRWNPRNFSLIADKLYHKGFTILITGTTNESNITKSVVSSMKTKATNLTGKLSLGGLAGLSSLSSLVISNDTGPLHLANAIGTKTLGIFWCGNLINGDPLNRKLHTPLISWLINCPLCGVNIAEKYPFEKNSTRCEHQTSFVNNIKTEEVLLEAERVLSQE